jgi:DNA invertase Pin-like site-specific DNA recombinase
MNAAAYIRVSTGVQRDNYSPETQFEAIADWCRDKGYQLAPDNIFRDVYTGKSSADQRPAFDMLQRVCTVWSALVDLFAAAHDDQLR